MPRRDEGAVGEFGVPLMDLPAFGLLLLAGIFAVVNGVNDGGTMVANGLKIPTITPGVAMGLLTAAVVLVPLLVGTRVAGTLATGLVDLKGASGQRALAIAIVAALVVVVLLTRSGLPTSLTLATIGGITGAGLGAGRSVGGTTVAVTLLLAAVAPLAGGCLAYGLARLTGKFTLRMQVGRVVGAGHRAAFLLQCIAYGANDGQKMLAIAILALGLPEMQGIAFVGLLLAIAVLFLLGSFVGLRRMAGTIGSGVMPVRPVNAVTAEVAAGSAVLGSSYVGAPVSMTQAVAGALIGSGLSEGRHRIRWRLVLNIGAAWVVTLPAALVLAGLSAFLVEALM